MRAPSLLYGLGNGPADIPTLQTHLYNIAWPPMMVATEAQREDTHPSYVLTGPKQSLTGTAGEIIFKAMTKEG